MSGLSNRRKREEALTLAEKVIGETLFDLTQAIGRLKHQQRLLASLQKLIKKDAKKSDR